MRRTLLPLMLLLAPGALAAQLPNTSTRALGLGAYTVSARGFEAAAWNPAALGVRGRPSFTLGLPMASVEFGSNAYGFGDFRKYADKDLTAQDKVDLLGKIDSTLRLQTNVGGSPFGISISRFALSFGTAGSVDGALGKDAVDLALNGNASRSGPGQFFTAAGSRGSGWAASTLAASVGWPLVTTPLGRITVGGTVKKVWGHALARGAETSSHFETNPAFLAHGAGQVLYTKYPAGFSVSGPGDLLGGDGSPGSGFGVDIGGILELPGGLTVGATLVNLVNTMSWKTDRFEYRRFDHSVTQSAGGQITDTKNDTTITGAAIDNDPAARALRDSLVAGGHFSRLARVGATMHVGNLLLAADGQVRLSDGLDHPPGQFVSVGAEYVLFRILPLRGGIGTDFSKSFVFSGGTGLLIGPFHLEVSAADITGGSNPGLRLGAGLALMF